MTILADSSVWIDYLTKKPSPQTDRLDRALMNREIMMGDLILVEVLQGFDTDRQFDTARERLGRLPTMTVAGRGIAIQAAANYRFFRARGITIRKTIDTLIATRCIVEGWPLLYTDRDFDPFVQHLGLRNALD